MIRVVAILVEHIRGRALFDQLRAPVLIAVALEFTSEILLSLQMRHVLLFL